jgi:hypothetical protein
MNEQIRIKSGDDIPDSFGKPRRAVRKSTVAIREPNGEEVFQKSWGTLTATPGVDWVIVQDSGDEYPIKRDIFDATYEQLTPGRFRKTATSKLVQVPVGVVAVLASNEGELEVVHPDFIVVGVKNEVYANQPSWVSENLEFVDDP